MCARALDGCTEHCIPCHFLQTFHREIDTDSVHAVLEDDTLSTQRSVPHGETLIALSYPTGQRDEEGREIRNFHSSWHPDGALSEIANLALTEESYFIAKLLNRRYFHTGITYTASEIDQILFQRDEMWTTDVNGDPMLIPNNGRCPTPSGHHIGSLPTTPVTARNNGRPRTSHRLPPPIYSPPRERHPGRILVPLALVERQSLRQQTPPPPYVSLLRQAQSFSQMPPRYTPPIVTNGSEAAANDFLDLLSDDFLPIGPIRHRTPRHRPGPLNRSRRPAPLQLTVPAPWRRPAPPDFVSSPNNYLVGRPRQIDQPRFVMRPSPFEEDFPRQTTLIMTSSPFDDELPQEDQPRFVMRSSPFEDDPPEGTQPSFFMRSSPFYGEFESPPFPAELDRPISWYATPTTDSLSPSYGPTDSESSDEEGDESPINFANYRRRQREGRQRQQQAIEEGLTTPEEAHSPLSSPDRDRLMDG